MKLPLVLLGFVHLLVGAAPTQPTFPVVVESLRTIPDGWTQCCRAEPHALIKLRLAITIPQASLFETKVIDIATPGNPLYGKHMTREELSSYLFIGPSVSGSIVNWIMDSGITSEQIRKDGNWIMFTATIEQAEALLDTQYFYWYKDGKQLIRTLQYSVRSDVRDFISMIQPTTYFNQPKPQFNSILRQQLAADQVSTTHNASDCNGLVTPECLRSLYQLGNFTTNPADGNSIGISGFLEQYAQYDDWTQFAATYDPQSLETGRNFSAESINGGVNPQHDLEYDSTEANLDIQYALSLTRNTPVRYFSTAGRGPLVLDDGQTIRDNQTTNEPYIEEILSILSLPDDQLPTVLSTSYGENEQSVPISYAVNVCFLFAQLGARGVSVIFSSGDSGVGQSCQANDGTNSTRFLPVFPASCPFVTSVGGTTQTTPERAVLFSSGGFSNIWPRPDYQHEAVDCYLNKLGSRFEGLYNRQGRGFPDVSAQAANFVVVDKGELITVSGTSAAAPVFAAIISNLNSVRFSLGMSSLGFLNPLLYGAGGKGFTDIVNGGSAGCRGTFSNNGERGNIVPGAGFNATESWDPVTGLGTPVWPGLVGVALFSP